jgi:surface polysaccharide O-acyltransferase-like enzyme
MKRITSLDGVRGIAILMVLIWHYFNNQIIPAPNTFIGYAHLATRLFWSGVDLFFVLSGFLIGGILLEQRDAQNYSYNWTICRSDSLLLGVVLALLWRKESFKNLVYGHKHMVLISFFDANCCCMHVICIAKCWRNSKPFVIGHSL